MYSILVTSQQEAWETDQVMRITANRLYPGATRDAPGLSRDDPKTYHLLNGSPGILMYEVGSDHVETARYGIINSVELSGGDLTFLFDEKGRLPLQAIRDHDSRVGMDNFAFGHTHWGVRDGGVPASLLAQLFIPPSHATKTLAAVLQYRDLPSVKIECDRAMRSVGTDPAAALTAACSLIESLLKTYIDDEKLSLPSEKSVSSLWGVVSKHLGFHAGPEENRDMQRLCSGLATVVQNVGSLRTHAGTAHGRGRDNGAILPYEARLAVNAANTFATFIIEAWDQRKKPTKAG